MTLRKTLIIAAKISVFLSVDQRAIFPVEGKGTRK
jgi:hypothetical protein